MSSFSGNKNSIGYRTKVKTDRQTSINISFDEKQKLHSNISNTLAKQRVKKSIDLIEHFEVINISKPYKTKQFKNNTPCKYWCFNQIGGKVSQSRVFTNNGMDTKTKSDERHSVFSGPNTANKLKFPSKLDSKIQSYVNTSMTKGISSYNNFIVDFNSEKYSTGTRARTKSDYYVSKSQQGKLKSASFVIQYDYKFLPKIIFKNCRNVCFKN
jgi:hypothetical protein